MQGAYAGLMGVANLIGPGLFNLTFAFAIGAAKDWSLPGAPYLVAAMLPALAIIVALRATKASGHSPPERPVARIERSEIRNRPVNMARLRRVSLAPNHYCGPQNDISFREGKS